MNRSKSLSLTSMFRILFVFFHFVTHHNNYQFTLTTFLLIRMTWNINSYIIIIIFDSISSFIISLTISFVRLLNTFDLSICAFHQSAGELNRQTGSKRCIHVTDSSEFKREIKRNETIHRQNGRRQYRRI